jgi:hypothetical protein
MPPPNGALNVRVCIGYKEAAPMALRQPEVGSSGEFESGEVFGQAPWA